MDLWEELRKSLILLGYILIFFGIGVYLGILFLRFFAEPEALVTLSRYV